MYTTWDIYCLYRKVQSRVKERGYRLPKDWDSHFNNKLKDNQRENLQKLTDFFNTKWQNIDPERYFEAGFQIYKNFTYHQFFDKKVIEMYKRLDKLQKRDIEASKKSIIDNVKYVLTQIEDDDKLQMWGPLKCYSRIKDSEYISKPINDYIDNKISTVFLTWLIYERMFVISDVERAMIPYVTENYREIIAQLREMNQFLTKLKRKIGS